MAHPQLVLLCHFAYLFLNRTEKSEETKERQRNPRQVTFYYVTIESGVPRGRSGIAMPNVRLLGGHHESSTFGYAGSLLALVGAVRVVLAQPAVKQQKEEKLMVDKTLVPRTSVHRIEADGVTVFYREAGPSDAPAVLLLHGFPTSSFQYRELIPRLADRYRVIAPDLPGFGFTEVPEKRHYKYTFDALAGTILAFTDALHLKRYALYAFDYGAPTGFRLAMARPERVTAIVSQNGNAYEEGLGDAWAPIRRYWSQPSSENREAIRNGLNLEGMRREYSVGIPNPEVIAPEGYTLDAALMARPGNTDIQLDLFLDYANNVKLYPAFQQYFRNAKPPLLAIWGKRDPYFIPAGAQAFQRDDPNASIQFLDTGHFALETHLEEIVRAMRDFLAKTVR
jgi:pimeloyl-ACP methyl ester carboxylesterase